MQSQCCLRIDTYGKVLACLRNTTIRRACENACAIGIEIVLIGLAESCVDI